jgi:hypothetical protein
MQFKQLSLVSSPARLAAFCFMSVAFANCQQPTRVWSIGPLVDHVASSSAFSASNGSLAPTRSVVFAGDRIVLAFKRDKQAEGAQTSQSVYQLISLDSETGAIKDKREIVSSSHLHLFATADAHVILSGSGLMRLTPDLKDAGTVEAGADGNKLGKVENISPDGAKLGNSTNPGFELIDAATLHSAKLSLSPAADATVNNKGFVTNTQMWTGEYPDETSFLTYVDGNGSYLIYHGRCGGKPQFLSDTLIFEPGCKKPLVLNTSGDLIKMLPLSGEVSFAGQSLNGSRFALEVGRFTTDHILQTERFVIFSTGTWKPITEINPEYIRDDQSWTAFSPDGSLFVVGSPVRLALYRIP